LKLVFSFAVLAGVLVVSGCGGTQCEQVCNQYNACTVAQRSINVDCIDFCGEVDALNARAQASGVTGCAAKWTTHLTCWRTNASSVCDEAATACDASALDWKTCVVPYCDQTVADGKFDRACQGEFEGCDTTLSLESPFQSRAARCL
jgi:hypothetical protein